MSDDVVVAPDGAEPSAAVEYIVVKCSIAGSFEEMYEGYEQTGPRYATFQEAVDGGWKYFDHDDFNIAHVQGNSLIWFGWMDEQHDLSDEDWAKIADHLGLVPAASGRGKAT